MNLSQSTVDQINKALKSDLQNSPEFYAKALEVAREKGAFKMSNVVFVHQQLYKINPHTPEASLQQILSHHSRV